MANGSSSTMLNKKLKNKKEVLAIIPARAGSKRIPDKNIRLFLGKPLISYAIKQALASKVIDRVIVDTDSMEIAAMAKKLGAEAPYLRPASLATDKAKVVDAITNLLGRLKKDELYEPTHVVILQTTSPLRELEDIDNCWDMMQKTNATTVLTICPTHPRLYHLTSKNDITLVNGSETLSTNMQAWPEGYKLNGCSVYIVKTSALLLENSIITKKTKGFVCPAWRSVDLDMPEDWVIAGILYPLKDELASRIINFH